ncbi:MAG: flagellar basal body rod C-terminal domain-containing protein, partial [Polyangiaceae bacterium]
VAMFKWPPGVSDAAKNMAIDPAIAGRPEKIAASTTASGLPSGNDNANKLSALASTSIGIGGTPTQTFASIASTVGLAKQSSDNEVELRTSTLAQAQTLNSSASGVSLDEEMANLTQYQRAFQASSKVLQTADALLQSLIDSLR